MWAERVEAPRAALRQAQGTYGSGLGRLNDRDALQPACDHQVS